MRVTCPACGLSFDAHIHRLTPTEKKVYDLLLAGRNVKQIAAELVKSEHTIEAHKRAVFVKRGVHSLHELYQQHYDPGPGVDEWI